jgi:hypothetical protein
MVRQAHHDKKRKEDYMKKEIVFTVFLVLALCFISSDIFAQCAMCKASAESSLESGSSAAAGINKGVLYLFLTPYLVGGTIAFFWWKAKRKAAE